jgi:hypothetical protein
MGSSSFNKALKELEAAGRIKVESNVPRDEGGIHKIAITLIASFAEQFVSEDFI